MFVKTILTLILDIVAELVPLPRGRRLICRLVWRQSLLNFKGQPSCAGRSSERGYLVMNGTQDIGVCRTGKRFELFNCMRYVRAFSHRFLSSAERFSYTSS
jgi:hypothetical protein